MVPTLSTEDTGDYSGEQRHLLLGLAAATIETALETGKQPQADTRNCDGWLAEERATFVTLKSGGALRGCIGTLRAHTSLCVDVVHNAWAAAFRDPRFRPVTPAEMATLEIWISVLGLPEVVEFTSEQDLVRRLRPGTDGLILREGGLTGTFLPSVWENLPDPAGFVRHLKIKAGLAPDYWSDTIGVARYTTQSFGAPMQDIGIRPRYLAH